MSLETFWVEVVTLRHIQVGYYILYLPTGQHVLFEYYVVKVLIVDIPSIEVVNDCHRRWCVLQQDLNWN